MEISSINSFLFWEFSVYLSKLKFDSISSSHKFTILPLRMRLIDLSTFFFSDCICWKNNWQSRTSLLVNICRSPHTHEPKCRRFDFFDGLSMRTIWLSHFISFRVHACICKRVKSIIRESFTTPRIKQHWIECMIRNLTEHKRVIQWRGKKKKVFFKVYYVSKRSSFSRCVMLMALIVDEHSYHRWLRWDQDIFCLYH